jgi:hypothetical protein
MNWMLRLIVLVGFLSILFASDMLSAQQPPEPKKATTKNKKELAAERDSKLNAAKTEFDPARVDAAKQHFAALLKGLKLNMELVETEHLLVFTDLEKAQADTIAGLSDKAFLTACRLLKIEDTKKLFPNKLAVVVLEKDRFYEPLQQAMFETPLTSSRSVLWRTEGEMPCLLVSNLPAYDFRTPGFSANWSQFTARFIGTVVLLQRYPTDTTHSRLPVWARNGFGVYASLLAQDSPETTQAYRALFRERLQDKVKIFDFTSGSKEFYNFHVTSVVEYLFSDSDSARFDALIQVLRKQKVVHDDRVFLDLPTELGWDRVVMEREWRYFAKTGKRLAR